MGIKAVVGMKVEKVKAKTRMHGEKVVKFRQKLVTFSGEVLIGIYIFATLVVAILPWLLNP